MNSPTVAAIGLCLSLCACGQALPSDEQLDQKAAEIVETQKQAIIAKTMANPDDDGFSSEQEVFDDPEAQKKSKDREPPAFGDPAYAEESADE